METTGERGVGVAESVGGLSFDLISSLALGMIALLVGCLCNVFRAEPLPWRYRSREQVMDASVARLQAPRSAPSGLDTGSDPTHEIGLEEFQSFVAEHKGAVVDARPAVFFREAHIPGALSLPRETFAEDYSRQRGQLDGYKTQPVAIYCSGADCPDSQLVADALTKLGYQKLVIYTSGWEEWSQTGLPQEGAAAAP